MNITDYMVQELMDDEFDKSVLHVPLFPVNMRLFKTSKPFRKTIQDIISYMNWVLNHKFEGYTQPRGISGANLGIPWNIIGIRRDDGNQFFINPVIVVRSPTKVTVMSNCGSIRLPQLIPVERHEYIDMEYYDVEGEPQSDRFFREDGGFTIQHEVDHNLGILITD